MDNRELLELFTERLDEFAKHRGYIEKAQAQAGRFSESVIERVVTDNTSRCVALCTDIFPMVAEVNDAIAGLAASSEDIEPMRQFALRWRGWNFVPRSGSWMRPVCRAVR